MERWQFADMVVNRATLILFAHALLAMSRRRSISPLFELNKVFVQPLRQPENRFTANFRLSIDLRN